MNIKSGPNGTEQSVGMLRVCEEPGCTTITLGGTCVAHDPEELTDREHPLGRPFARAALAGERTTAGSV